ncbi:ATP-binding protein, partial [Flavihumibacter sp. CACIAM 22H1]|uniref:sensor histidine kinase n=1 Tax=Flavihumibacter sp. CACIAM 22H1 TaxID=1812911 RepID=UPI0025C3424F
LAGAGLLEKHFMETGFLGQSWLNPTALFGLRLPDPVSHSLFWSLLLNTGLFLLVSIRSKKGIQEIYQGQVFVDVFQQTGNMENRTVWKDNASLPALRALLQNFIGADRAGNLLQHYAQRHQISLESSNADPRLVTFTEKILAGIIGSASAHILVSRVAKAEELSLEEVINMLRESQQLIELNKELRRKSSDLTKASEQLSALNSQLLEMDELKDEFLYTVTHELRTPLTSIRALTELVHDNRDMPEQQQVEFLSAVIRETERLSWLITQVLNLERFESGKHTPQFRQVNFNQVLQEILTAVQPLVREKNLRIKGLAETGEILVECDPHLISQVVYNLLTNAIKFSPPGGIVQLSAKKEKQELLVQISDQGKGIPTESLAFIFDKFYQAPNQTLTKPEGSGLGLAISKKIIELHAGQITAFNGAEGGAVLRFTLPTDKFESV